MSNLYEFGDWLDKGEELSTWNHLNLSAFITHQGVIFLLSCTKTITLCVCVF